MMPQKKQKVLNLHATLQRFPYVQNNAYPEITPPSSSEVGGARVKVAPNKFPDISGHPLYLPDKNILKLRPKTSFKNRSLS